jgi:hypothetical protein
LRSLVALIIVTGLLAGCQQPAPPATQPVYHGDEVIATIAGLPVTRAAIEKPMLDHYGDAWLQVLVYTMQLELVKHEAALTGVTVSSAEIKAELEKSLRMVLPSVADGKIDVEQALSALQQQLRIGPAAVDLWLLTNAHLRKMIEPKVLAAINDNTLREAFGILYGETALVRHIQLGNMLEVARAQQRLAAGEAFEKVATEMSRDRLSATNGGLLHPFSREARHRSQAFKEATFALKPGEIAGPVQSGEFYHLIQLVEKIPPKAVKYEDPEIQAVVRDWATRGITGNAMNAELRRIVGAARDHVKIFHPALRDKFRAEEEKRRLKETTRSELEKLWADAQAKAATQATAAHPATSATRPSTTPATTAQTRPPATMPGG